MSESQNFPVSEELWDDIVGRIYESAYDQRERLDLLQDIGQPIGSHALQLVTISPKENATQEDVVIGLEDSNAMQEFEKLVTSGEQIRANYAIRKRELSVVYDYLHSSESEMKSDAFYQEHAVPLGVAYYAAMIVRNDADAMTALAYFREKDTGHFSNQEIEYLRRLTPHIRRSLDLSQKLLRRGALHGMETIVNAMDRAAVVVDRTLRVSVMNQRAADLVSQKDGLEIVGNTLVVHDIMARDALYQEARLALGQMSSLAPDGNGQICAAKKTGGLPYRLTVTPLSSVLTSSNRKHGLIVITDPDADIELRSLALQEDFGLTPAECRVIALLLSGKSLANIAQIKCRKLATVRSQLKSVFRKTGCHSQAQLISFIINNNYASR